MTSLNEIYNAIAVFAPWELAEEWDNSGLQVGSLKQDVKKIMIALDFNSAVFAEGVKLAVDGFLVHHPLFFRPVRQIDLEQTVGKLTADLLQQKQFLLSAHTNFDAAPLGINAYLAAKMHLQEVAPLVPSNGLLADSGIGKFGILTQTMSLEQFLAVLRHEFPTASLKYNGKLNREIRRVAVCSGSGKSFIGQALQLQADVYVTADLGYHDFCDAAANNLSLIDIGHFDSEQCFVPLMAQLLEKFCLEKGIEIYQATCQSNPYSVI